MNWESELDGIRERRTRGTAHGGDAAVDKQHERGKLTVRERIDALLDPESFREYGRMAGGVTLDDNGGIADMTPANYVVGYGRINGRAVAIGGEDFTVKGGSPNAAGLRKSVYAEHLAVTQKIPLVRLLEGGGGSVGSGDEDPRKPRTVGSPVYEAPRFAIMAEAMGKIPVVSAALGPVAGFPAGRLVASHFAVMVREISQVMVGGPALVQRALGRAHQLDQIASVLTQIAFADPRARFAGDLGRVAVGNEPQVHVVDETKQARRSLQHDVNRRAVVRVADQRPAGVLRASGAVRLADRPRQEGDRTGTSMNATARNGRVVG